MSAEEELTVKLSDASSTPSRTTAEAINKDGDERSLAA
jgi:hypothetical protein